jgi:hypothetical protein
MIYISELELRYIVVNEYIHSLYCQYDCKFRDRMSPQFRLCPKKIQFTVIYTFALAINSAQSFVSILIYLSTINLFLTHGLLFNRPINI